MPEPVDHAGGRVAEQDVAVPDATDIDQAEPESAPRDLDGALDDLTAMIENARSMPLSSSCVINRAEALERLTEVRELLPGQLQQAGWVLRDRDEVIAEGREQAAALVTEAAAERDRLVAEHEVLRAAREQAETVLAQARESARAMRAEVEDFVDTKLATFEVVLQKTIATVERGRDRLRGSSEADALRDETEPDLPG